MRKLSFAFNTKIFLPESIIYTDTISGLPDFKRYLRKFGKNAHVLEPDSLKKEMEESVEKALSRYEEETNNE